MSLHTLPHVKSVTTLFLESLLPVLRKNIETEITFLVYQPDKINVSTNDHTGEKILDIHDYQNALQVVQKEKPDLIFAAADSSLIDYALSLSGKNLGIPVFSWFPFDLSPSRTTFVLLKSYLKRFFESSVPTDTNVNKKTIMRRGKFFLYKYLFLMRTQKALQMTWLEVFRDFLMLVKDYVVVSKYSIHPRFANTLHFLENDIVRENILKCGFQASSLVVTGSPMYDLVFQKLNKQKHTIKSSKINVLIAASTLYEAGYWTQEQRNFTIKSIVSEIQKHKDKISLIVKIHPSSSVLSDYESLIHDIDSSIPLYQEGGILEFLGNIDVEISFSTSSPEWYALLYGKPIIICDFFNIQGDIFLEKNLAARCTEPSLIVKTIHDVLSSNPATEDKKEKFIKTYMYKWDGLCAERISNKLLELLNIR